MAETEHLKASIERIHDIADTVRDEPDLPPRAKQALEEIATIAHHQPESSPELAIDGEGPFALGGGSIMDGKVEE